MQLDFPHSTLDLNLPRVMGILNVTPDSFSDGGLYATKDAAVEHALRLDADNAAAKKAYAENTTLITIIWKRSCLAQN